MTFFRMKFLSASLALLPIASMTAAHAVSLPPTDTGLTVSVDEKTGGYTVAAADPKWTFQGTVGAPVSRVKTIESRDALGDYEALSFAWTQDGPRIGEIRAYRQRPVVLFRLTVPEASAAPPQDFPDFTAFPQDLHALSFEDGAFSPATARLRPNGPPWAFFDDSADTAILSPASDFLVSQMHGDGKTSIASGLDPRLTGLPAGFTHETALVIGKGIDATFHAWGGALTARSHKPRPADDADLLVKYLGYWTDNGGAYYYKYDPSLGYAGTLLALAKRYRAEDIPIRYLQLDSWWYSKTRTNPNGTVGGPKNPSLPAGTWNAYGGTLDYSASPDLFPDGLAAFRKKVGLPLVTHGRWIDPTSPYRQDYKISGVAPVDPRWWDDRMDYLAKSGVVCYEQDWLNVIYGHSPEMAGTLSAGPDFAGGMADAARRHHMTIQYCMTTPRFFLQSTQYADIVTSRVSDDRFDRGKWRDFLYTSLLADSLHLRPWTDTFMSTERGNLLLATLSSGPVGTADPMGKESRDNLMMSVRGDGVIVKPDAPLLPTDASLIADAAERHEPLVSATDTDHGVKTVLLFVDMRRGDFANFSFSPTSMGITAPCVAYREENGAAIPIDAGQTFRDVIGSDGWAYYEIAPFGKSGIAFLGDEGKFVGLGRQRIPAVQDTAQGLTATVAFAPGEKSVTLHGYAPFSPAVTVRNGTAGPVSYDPATRHFTVAVSPNPAARAKRIGGDPVVLADVTLSRG